jgi:hypothetical protein
MDYKKDGAIDIASVYQLVVAGTLLGALMLVLIFVPVLGGAVYQETESQIDAITDANVKASVKATALEGFATLETFSSYTGLFVLGIIIVALLSLIIGGLVGRSYNGGAGGVL